jgi:hypothetical protein
MYRPDLFFLLASSQIKYDYSYDKLSGIKTKAVEGISHMHEYSYDSDGQLETFKKETPSPSYETNRYNRTHKNGTEIASYDNQDRLLI